MEGVAVSITVVALFTIVLSTIVIRKLQKVADMLKDRMSGDVYLAYLEKGAAQVNEMFNTQLSAVKHSEPNTWQISGNGVALTVKNNPYDGGDYILTSCGHRYFFEDSASLNQYLVEALKLELKTQVEKYLNAETAEADQPIVIDDYGVDEGGIFFFNYRGVKMNWTGEKGFYLVGGEFNMKAFKSSVWPLQKKKALGSYG